jgi:hypothetical protein
LFFEFLACNSYWCSVFRAGFVRPARLSHYHVLRTFTARQGQIPQPRVRLHFIVPPALQCHWHVRLDAFVPVVQVAFLIRARQDSNLIRARQISRWQR